MPAAVDAPVGDAANRLLVPIVETGKHLFFLSMIGSAPS
jgi:hypothetical protein